MICILSLALATIQATTGLVHAGRPVKETKWLAIKLSLKSPIHWYLNKSFRTHWHLSGAPLWMTSSGREQKGIIVSDIGSGCDLKDHAKGNRVYLEMSVAQGISIKIDYPVLYSSVLVNLKVLGKIASRMHMVR